MSLFTVERTIFNFSQIVQLKVKHIRDLVDLKPISPKQLKKNTLAW